MDNKSKQPKIFRISDLSSITLSEIDGYDSILISDRQPSGKWNTKRMDVSSIVEFLTKKDGTLSAFTNTLIGHSVISGDIHDELLNYGKTIDYVSSDKKMYLKNGDSVLGTVDCTDFIKDGMLSSVELCGKVIVLKFNTDSGTTPISVNLSTFVDVYSAGYGLCCANNEFRIDEGVVATLGHQHYTDEILDLENVISVFEKTVNLSSAAYTASSDYATAVHRHGMSDVDGISTLSSSAVSYIQNSVLTNYYKQSETSSSTQISNKIADVIAKFDEYQLCGNYMTANALDGISDDWNTAFSRTSAVVGSIGYKNSLSTSDIQGYEDTKYKNGFGISAVGTEFGVNTDVIALKSHVHQISDVEGLQSSLDGKSNVGHSHEISDVSELQTKLNGKAENIHVHQISDVTELNSSLKQLSDRFEEYQIKGNYMSANALDGLSDNWNTAYSRTSADVGSIGYRNSLSTSDIVGYKDTTYSSSGKGLKLNETVFSIDYGELCQEIDISSYSKTDTKYTAGTGIEITPSPENKINLTANIDGVAYEPTQFVDHSFLDLTMRNEYPVVMFDNLMTEEYNFSSLSASPDYTSGVYTWEIMCKSSSPIGSITGFNENIKYVGTNLSNGLIVDTPILANSTAVFAIRLIRRDGKSDMWNVNYCYQF